MKKLKTTHRHSAPTFCLLGASYNTGNRGVAAIASGTINALMHTFPCARIFLLDYGREPETYAISCSNRIAQVELVNLRFSWRIWLRNNIARLLLTALTLRLVPSTALRTKCISRNPYLKRLADANFVGSIAGGDSFSDTYGLNRLLYVSMPQILVLLLRKPLVLLPQSIGPFKSAVAKCVAQYITLRASRIYTRERLSPVVTQSRFGRDSQRPQFSFDMAFALEPTPPPQSEMTWLHETQSDGSLVGFNLSGLLYLGGYNRENMFRLRTDYRKLVRDVISFFIDKLGCRILLVPHAFKPGDSSESDTIACSQVLDELQLIYPEQLYAYTGDYTASELKYIIGRCDFFLGSRMHACIAALSQCVPAVGLAYSRKFDGVLTSIQMEELVVDLRAHDDEEVIKRIRAAYESRKRLRSQLERVIPEVQQTVMRMFHGWHLGASTDAVFSSWCPEPTTSAAHASIFADES